MAGAKGHSRDREGGPQVAYVLPRHPAETDRLDVQHYALREALGANYLAPVEQPGRVLDVGAGTGQWGYDLSRDFPDALVVGFDLVAPKPGAPRGCCAIRGNVLQPLPFTDGAFDFVHQRLMMAGVPLRAWRGVVGELARVLRSGGWLELVEGHVAPEPRGPASDRLAELLWRLARSAGIDSTGIVFRDLRDHLASADLHRLQRRTFALPLGDWGGHTGTLMASDFRALYLRLAPIFEARFGASMGECHDLVSRAQREWEQLHTTYSFAIAYGQK